MCLIRYDGLGHSESNGTEACECRYQLHRGDIISLGINWARYKIKWHGGSVAIYNLGKNLNLAWSSTPCARYLVCDLYISSLESSGK